jgi:hypothetical protein
MTFDDVKNRVFLGMKMKGNTGARPVALFNQGEDTAGLGAI